LLRRRYDTAHGMDRDLLHGAVGQLSIVSPEFVSPEFVPGIHRGVPGIHRGNWRPVKSLHNSLGSWRHN
jgi:hypothetical protein